MLRPDTLETINESFAPAKPFTTLTVTPFRFWSLELSIPHVEHMDDSAKASENMTLAESPLDGALF